MPKIITGNFSDQRFRQAVFRVLKSNFLCSIATVDPDNRASISTAYFCYSKDLELFFLSDSNSAHSKNLSSNPSLAMTVFRSTQKWGGYDRGLQLFGTCKPATNDLSKRAERLYARRFKSYAKWITGNTEIDKSRASVLRSYTFYQFLPTKLKLLDEAKYGGGVIVRAFLKRETLR